jgi:hypothetical protein
MLSRWITAALIAVLTASCSSTTFRTTWKAPDVGPVDYAGKKVAAIFISAEESTRRRAEEALARELTSRGAQGLAAYTVVATDQLKDQSTARATLRAAGCAGALVMRITAREQQISSYPGAYTGMRYSTFSGYSGYGWGMAYDSSYLRSDTVLTIETLVYELEVDKLLWAGTSEIFEPSDIEKRVVELAIAAAEEMKKEGLIR